MAKHGISASMNIGHLRTLAEICALFANDGLPLSDEQVAAFKALAHVTAGPVSGNALGDALRRWEGDKTRIPRAAVLERAKKEWAYGSNGLSIADNAMITESRDDGKTVNGYWVEAYVYVSAGLSDSEADA